MWFEGLIDEIRIFDYARTQAEIVATKDIILKDDIYTPHLDEIRAGLGNLDYTVFLKELSKFPDVPLMLEHLPDAGQYKLAADHIRSVAAKLGLSFT